MSWFVRHLQPVTVPVDASAVAAATTRLLEDPEVARSLSEAGLGLVRAHLDRRA